MNHKSRTNNVTVETLQRNKSYQKKWKKKMLLRVLFVHKHFTNNTGIKQGNKIVKFFIEFNRISGNKTLIV